MDVSADLTELARTPVAVVCAGIKSILDIPKTLEFLETQGVPTVAYGADEFPAFFTRCLLYMLLLAEDDHTPLYRHSGCRAPCRVDSPAEAAALLRCNLDLQLGCGVVIGAMMGGDQNASIIMWIQACPYQKRLLQMRRQWKLQFSARCVRQRSSRLVGTTSPLLFSSAWPS